MSGYRDYWVLIFCDNSVIPGISSPLAAPPNAAKRQTVLDRVVWASLFSPPKISIIFSGRSQPYIVGGSQSLGHSWSLHARRLAACKMRTSILHYFIPDFSGAPNGGRPSTHWLIAKAVLRTTPTVRRPQMSCAELSRLSVLARTGEELTQPRAGQSNVVGTRLQCMLVSGLGVWGILPGALLRLVQFN